MCKRLITAGLVCCGLVVPASALAATEKLTITAKAGVLNPGNNARLIGGVTEGTLGEGGLVIHNKLITKNTGRSTFTVFTKTGSFSGTDKLAGKTVGKGNTGKTVLTGSATITSGTGSFTGATGSFKITGVSPANLSYFLVKFTGSVTLP